MNKKLKSEKTKREIHLESVVSDPAGKEGGGCRLGSLIPLSRLADPIPPVRVAAFQWTPSLRRRSRTGGTRDPADEERIGGLRWHSWPGVIFERRTFQWQRHAAGDLRWKVGGGAGTGTVPFLVDSSLLASQTLFLYTFSLFFSIKYKLTNEGL
jgi:hypothetical protein